MKVFVAGATGVLGRVLIPQLVARGHEVAGMTRSDRPARLRDMGLHEYAQCDGSVIAADRVVANYFSVDSRAKAGAVSETAPARFTIPNAAGQVARI